MDVSILMVRSSFVIRIEETSYAFILLFEIVDWEHLFRYAKAHSVGEDSSTKLTKSCFTRTISLDVLHTKHNFPTTST